MQRNPHILGNITYTLTLYFKFISRFMYNKLMHTNTFGSTYGDKIILKNCK